MTLRVDDLQKQMAEADTFAAELDEAENKKLFLDDFFAHMPDHKYIFRPTRDFWPAVSVDSRLPWPMDNGEKIKPSKWLDKNAAVEQVVWAPGEAEIIAGRLIDGGGWVIRPSVTVFNLYRPPHVEHGAQENILPWLNHIKAIYPNPTEHGHLIKWFAHKAQHPGIKINHALVLGGSQGIGKDSVLEPLKYAVGAWNFSEVSPAALMGRFNPFVKSVVLRVSEARDLGEVDRFKFYDHTKPLIAAPPDVLMCDEKNVREHAVLNCLGVIITTNHRTDCLYLPSDDRRHFVLWSESRRQDFGESYWAGLWTWYQQGGIANVTAFLRSLDISDFDPKAAPPKTEAFFSIVNAGRPVEESELEDIIDALGRPKVVSLENLVAQAELMQFREVAEWLNDRKNRRQIPHRLDSIDYRPLRNSNAKDGLFKVNGRRQALYGDSTTSLSERLFAAQNFNPDQ